MHFKSPFCYESFAEPKRYDDFSKNATSNDCGVKVGIPLNVDKTDVLEREKMFVYHTENLNITAIEVNYSFYQ